MQSLEWSKFPSSYTGTTALEPSTVAISLRVGGINTRGKEYPVQTALHYRNGRICLGPRAVLQEGEKGREGREGSTLAKIFTGLKMDHVKYSTHVLR